MTSSPVVLIGGYGPGLGRGLAEVFASNGYLVATISRQGARSSSTFNVTADLTERCQAHRAMDEVIKKYGRIDVYVHNVAALHIAPYLETSPDQFKSVWAATFLSAVHMTQAALPHMLKQKSGSIIFSGATAAIKGGKNFSAFASAKFALRALSQSLAREYHTQGIHVAHVILDGLMFGTDSVERFGGTEETSILPRDAAAEFLNLARQPKSAWSQEIDIRPYSEGF